MSYSETLQYLYASLPAFHQVGAKAYKPGLDRAWALLHALRDPHTRFPSVHVAGTNGKGSTSHLMAAALQSSSLRVGLFTSPHLVDFRERIRINGVPISEEAVVNWVENHRSLLDTVQPSFFETTMALAFDYFAEQQVDMAVVEVGLGGRLDATNVLLPRLSVITNIGLDHTEFLGSSLPAIAAEKAGIIKPHVPVVVGESHPLTRPVFEAAAAQQGSPLVFADAALPMPSVPCELTGAYQQRNCQTAYTALRQLGVGEDAIRAGFAHVCTLTGLRGRWETLLRDANGEALLLCDTGHNSHGISTYVASLRAMMTERPDAHLRVVFGMVQDKDVSAVMRLLPMEATYYWTQAATHRAIPAEEMRRLGLLSGLIGEAYPSVEEAVRVALHDAHLSEGLFPDLVFVGGSNYVVGELLSLSYA